jgi:osmotically-inducible protein OsmY
MYRPGRAPLYTEDGYHHLEEIGDGRYGRPEPWRGAPQHERRVDFRGRGPKDFRRSDASIREAVCERFLRDPDLDPSDVSVTVTDAVVTLTGTVATRAQKHHAEDLALAVRGVSDVMTRVRVRRSR